MPHLPPSTQEALDARAKRRDRCTSDIEGSSTLRQQARKSPHREVPEKSQPDQSMSLSLPNVLDELPVGVCDIPLDTQPPKSTSGDNFNSLRDYDALSEDSYGLSDNERSARSDVGVSSSSTSRPQVYNTTFTAKRVGNVIVKRVVSKSEEDENQAGSSRKHLKEFPFRSQNMVPVEIDGPNVDLSSSLPKHKPVYTPSGTLLRKPRVISVEEDGYETVKVSPDSGHYSTLFSPASTSKEVEEIRYGSVCYFTRSLSRGRRKILSFLSFFIRFLVLLLRIAFLSSSSSQFPPVLGEAPVRRTILSPELVTIRCRPSAPTGSRLRVFLVSALADPSTIPSPPPAISPMLSHRRSVTPRRRSETP